MSCSHIAPNGQPSLLAQQLLDTYQDPGLRDRVMSYIHSDNFKVQFNLSSPINPTKQGVEQLFNENESLANAVYEALGFTENISDEQKQQALQLYSQYLSNFVNTNFDSIISDLQSKNLLEKKCS